jgi:hypothetical protein
VGFAGSGTVPSAPLAPFPRTGEPLLFTFPPPSLSLARFRAASVPPANACPYLPWLSLAPLPYPPPTHPLLLRRPSSLQKSSSGCDCRSTWVFNGVYTSFCGSPNGDSNLWSVRAASRGKGPRGHIGEGGRLSAAQHRRVRCCPALPCPARPSPALTLSSQRPVGTRLAAKPGSRVKGQHNTAHACFTPMSNVILGPRLTEHRLIPLRLHLLVRPGPPHTRPTRCAVKHAEVHAC